MTLEEFKELEKIRSALTKPRYKAINHSDEWGIYPIDEPPEDQINLLDFPREELAKWVEACSIMVPKLLHVVEKAYDVRKNSIILGWGIGELDKAFADIGLDVEKP